MRKFLVPLFVALAFLDPNNSRAQSSSVISSAYEKLKNHDYRGAIEDYTFALRESKDSSIMRDIYFNRGYAKDRLEDFPGALDDFLKVIDLDPKYKVAFYNVTCMYSLLMDTASSFKYLEKMLAFGKTVSDLSDIAKDFDFNNIRDLPAFKSILLKYFSQEELDEYPKLFSNSSLIYRRRNFSVLQ